MAKTVVTWVLLADGAVARVLTNNGPGQGLKRSAGHEFSVAHPLARDIVSDREGRQADRAAGGGGSRHAMKPRTEPQRHLEKEFAKTLARFLEKEALKKSYQRLVLVASPNMLGDLRSELSVHALAAVSDQVNKDLVHMDDAAVAKHLSEIVN